MANSSAAQKRRKLDLLVDSEGYDSLDDLIAATISDSVSPAICMNDGCDLHGGNGARPAGGLVRGQQVVLCLRVARHHAKLAECPATLRKIRSAIKSADGAKRHLIARRLDAGRPS